MSRKKQLKKYTNKKKPAEGKDISKEWFKKEIIRIK
jgi:hypothetical protein